MVRIGGFIVITHMAACAGVWRIVVTALVTCGAIIRHSGMRPIERIIVVVNGKRRRLPAIGRVAFRTIRRDGQRRVIWIGGLVIVRCMATCASRGRAGKTRRMAVDTIGRQVCARERECRRIMIKYIGGIARRMASQTSGVGVRISVYAGVLIVCLRVGVAGSAGKFGKI